MPDPRRHIPHSNHYRALFGSKLSVSGGHGPIKIWAASEKYSEREMAATGQSMARILSSALFIFCNENLGRGEHRFSSNQNVICKSKSWKELTHVFKLNKEGLSRTRSLAKGLLCRRGSWNYYVGFAKTIRNQGPSSMTHPTETQQQKRGALCCAWSSQELRAELQGQGKHFKHRSWEPGRTCLGCEIEGEAYTVIKILSIFCHMF